MKYGQWLMAALLVLNVSACGHKGSLKTPSQIEAEQAKKEREAAKQEKEKKEAPPPAAVQEQP